jgi:UDP-N-acetylmuramoylalanine--D-glutamate ligase
MSKNYLAAAAAVWPYVTPDAIAESPAVSAGVAHRLELVRELDGVRYYNSSIDTSPTGPKAALRALAERKEKSRADPGRAGQDV